MTLVPLAGDQDMMPPVTIRSTARVILASPRAIFRAFVDPEVLAKWRAPAGMTMRIGTFDPRVGGGYRAELAEIDMAAAATPARLDVRFLEMLPDERIVETIRFDGLPLPPAAPVTLTAALTPVAGGTKVSLRAENVADECPISDQARMDGALKALATLLE